MPPHRPAWRWRVVGLGLLAFGLAGWAVLAWWVLKADPWHRLTRAAQLGRVLGQGGKVILVGDSILQPVGAPCAAFVNLAVPGARAGDVPDSLVGEIGRHNPSAILVMIGINDLRRGDSAETTAQSIAALARSLQRAAPAAKVIALAPLALTANDMAGAAEPRSVHSTAGHLRELLRQGGMRLVDFSSLFGVDGLDPTLTYDGLHLNAAGTARLSSLLQAVAVAATGDRVCP
jgi:lysophospholipase L1-like esterase